MSRLELRLLGPPELHLNGQKLVLPERLSYPITAFRGEELGPPIREAILEQVERGLAVLIVKLKQGGVLQDVKYLRFRTPLILK
ncbi:hypothetical protein [Allomeiothermus silvanus]|uniref:hypothetical protein n=1 Tax=Allomeiothermus silvanus TaxID=52022 RepID=UPI0023F3AA68|nr:hypothetical protein [Allomeiothermus silvanus]